MAGSPGTITYVTARAISIVARGSDVASERVRAGEGYESVPSVEYASLRWLAKMMSEALFPLHEPNLEGGVVRNPLVGCKLMPIKSTGGT